MPLRFESAPRTILLAAHPDDESIGAGTILSSLPALTIILATDGAPLDMHDARRCGFTTREAYADARKRELHRALEVAEADHAELVEWGVPDKQAAHELPKLTKLLTPLLRTEDMLMTHPYEGGHPDHDSCAFAAHAAARLCGKKLTLVEFTSYHMGPAGLVAEEFLGESQDVLTIELTEEQKGRKRWMLSCFATQSETLKQFPIERERFRPAPAYDFMKPPHEGRLLYEQFGWGITGSEFCNHATRAMDELGLKGKF
jgi:N-acetylglucosamine malate deacetylase 2